MLTGNKACISMSPNFLVFAPFRCVMEIGNCTRLTMRDLESLRNSLVLNGIITEDADPEQPTYSLQPGWDDKEAAQLQDSTESD